MEYCLAIKRDEVLIYAKTWINHKKHYAYMKEPSHKRPHLVYNFIYMFSRTSKETERLMVVRSRKKEVIGNDI